MLPDKQALQIFHVQHEIYGIMRVCEGFQGINDYVILGQRVAVVRTMNYS